ncbi:hypothetical protein AKJ08_0025 [Vulgatibacter incomptus]|uniref:Uncharacterized protein n=1 Tax=Vulgatibacter incomptus TaxID=1391653 RepID=A0A0K1P7X6_9BACT|nr:hypothetical protein AKJ08_0025 [Vulgatibacter incomptus]
MKSLGRKPRSRDKTTQLPEMGSLRSSDTAPPDELRDQPIARPRP